MKGISSVVVTTLLLLISISTVIVAFYQFNKISTETTNKGDELLVDARISPKVLGIACFNTSGYAIVSVDSPITVPIYYEVKYGLDEIASGFVSTNITDVGNIYFNATMDDEKEYKIKMSSTSWSFEEYCTSTHD
ncbi:MAG: hypothetical protein GOU98_01925 [Candidatus Altiarchaeota archaeon]|nr:hypothetical protein [Candidatus Altiarchaeota archaeon]